MLLPTQGSCMQSVLSQQRTGCQPSAAVASRCQTRISRCVTAGQRVRAQSQAKGSTMSPSQPQKSQDPLRPTSPAVDDALRAAEALLDSIKQGGGEPSMSSSNLGYTDFGYACDENGCVLVVQQDSTNTTNAPFQHMLSGPNWSLGLIENTGPYMSQSFATATFGTENTMSMDFDPLYTGSDSSSSSGGSDHAAIVAGPSWRVLLSAADFADFVHMLGQLRMAVASLRFQGLWNAGNKDRPPSKAKWEGSHFRLTAVYAPGEPGFSVHMSFNHQEDYSKDVRHISMSWPADVTAALVAALDDTMGFRPLAARGT